jgi:hypothetical protein
MSVEKNESEPESTPGICIEVHLERLESNLFECPIV